MKVRNYEWLFLLKTVYLLQIECIWIFTLSTATSWPQSEKTKETCVSVIVIVLVKLSEPRAIQPIAMSPLWLRYVHF